MSRKIRFSLLFLLLLAAGALLLTTQSAWAQDTPNTPTDDQVNAVAKQLYCPVCENIPLDVCATQACAQWRDLIREKLAAGWSDEQIKMYFVDQYGDRVLATPPARGFNWLVYVIPPLAFLAGAFILYRAFRAWQGQPAAGETTVADKTVDPAAQDDYVARLEEELRRR